MSGWFRPPLGQAIGGLAPAFVVVALQVLLFPVPLGIALQGLTIGLLGALVAVGMALVYRANRVVSFAQADLGMVPAALAVLLVQRFAWHYLLALGLGVVASVVLGALVELAVVRRFFRSPRLILTVATIGLAQLLAVITLLMPEWIASLTGREPSEVAPTGERVAFPWDLRFTVEPLIFDADYVVAWIVAPLALAAVALFLRATDVGIALRGSGENAERASLLGVPVGRLNTYVWAVAGLLSFAGLYLRAGILGLPLGTASTFMVLLLALAALTLGRLGHLPTVAASAVALGLLEQGVAWNDEIRFGLFSVAADEAVLTAPIVGVIIVVALLVQRAGRTRADQDATASWQSADEVRPVPPELRRVPAVRVGRVAGAALAAVVLLVLPHLLSSRHALLAAAVMIYALITLSVVVLTGWAGQVSLGQMGFVGIGAAVGATATGEWGLDLTLGLALAGLAGAAVALVVGLPALRLQGLYLGVVTLAFGLATTLYFLNRQFFDWLPAGRVERPPLLGEWRLDSPTRLYYVCLGGLALVAVLVQGVRRSRAGRVLVATRENERGAQAFGVSVVRAKLTAFALSGFVAAFAGGLLVHHQQSFSLDLFGPEESLLAFTSAVLGGLGSVLGAALGALYLQGGRWFLPEDFHLLSTSAGVLLVLLLAPGGLGGLAYRGRDLALRWLARRHGIVSPSLLADTAEAEPALPEAPALAEAEAEVPVAPVPGSAR